MRGSQTVNAIRILQSYLMINPDGSIEASQIHSKAAYEAWLTSKSATHSPNEAKRFHRALTNHVSGVDGRVPFEPKEEEAILKVIRQRIPWPCFLPDISIGQSGFRSVGFHEKQQGALSRYRNPHKRFKKELPPREEEDYSAVHELPFFQNVLDFIAVTTTTVNNGIVEQWQSISALCRMAAFSKYPQMMKEVSPAYALELCTRLSVMYSDSIVMVYDPRQNEIAKRLVAQNSVSVEYFGSLLGVNTRGVLLFQSRDIPRLLYQVARAMLHNGQEFSLLNMALLCANKTYIAFDLTVHVDEFSFFVVFVGKEVVAG